MQSRGLQGARTSTHVSIMSKLGFTANTSHARLGANLEPPEAAADSLSDTKFVSTAARERAQNHYNRALERIQLRNSSLAVQELRDAIKHDPYNSEYHAMLGKIHFEKGLTGMANINLRQALTLNPDDKLALKCLKKLKGHAASPTDSATPSLVNRLLGLIGASGE